MVRSQLDQNTDVWCIDIPDPVRVMVCLCLCHRLTRDQFCFIPDVCIEVVGLFELVLAACIHGIVLMVFTVR